jgi:hypothetical protein
MLESAHCWFKIMFKALSILLHLLEIWGLGNSCLQVFATN